MREWSFNAEARRRGGNTEKIILKNLRVTSASPRLRVEKTRPEIAEEAEVAEVGE